MRDSNVLTKKDYYNEKDWHRKQKRRERHRRCDGKYDLGPNQFKLIWTFFWFVFVGSLCYLFGNGWPLLLLIFYAGGVL